MAAVNMHHVYDSLARHHHQQSEGPSITPPTTSPGPQPNSHAHQSSQLPIGNLTFELAMLRHKRRILEKLLEDHGMSIATA